MKTQTSLRSGFTLVEILVVLMLIAVLSGGVFMLMRASNTKEGIARTTASVQAVATLLESYHNNFGNYPRVTTPTSTAGYYPLNFTFKAVDGGSCNKCNNKSSQDGVQFGLCSHFVPRATVMKENSSADQMEYFLECFEDTSVAKEDDNDNNAWQLEYGSGVPEDTCIKGLINMEASDSRLQAVYADWKRMVREGMVYSGQSICPYCHTSTFIAGISSDAWDNSLYYYNDGGIGVVISAGPDGTLGTSDDIRSDGGVTSTDDDDDED